MSFSVPVPPSGLSLLTPADLDRTQRGVLVGVVLLVHVALAGALLMSHEPAEVQPPSSAIEVTLITDEPAVEVSAPVAPPMPEPPPPTPAPRPPVAAPRSPVQATPQVLASTAKAQPSEMVVPPAPVDNQPAPTVAEPQPQPSSAAPVAQVAPVTAPIPKAPPQPKDLPSSAVRYLVEPPHVYPRVSRELGETGVVKLRLLIDEQGRLKNVQVTQSSGYPRLDQQAVASMRQARFQPLIDNGEPREVTTTASIVFSLEEQ